MSRPLIPVRFSARGKNPLIVLVGANGQHKREIARRAALAHPRVFQIVPTMTNRELQSGDGPEEFVRLDKDVINNMIARDELVEWQERGDVIYGRTPEMIATVLEEYIGVAVMSTEGARRVAECNIICYGVRIVTSVERMKIDLPPEEQPIRVEIHCTPDEAGVAYALEQIKDLMEQLRCAIRSSSRPPPPHEPPAAPHPSSRPPSNS